MKLHNYFQVFVIILVQFLYSCHSGNEVTYHGKIVKLKYVGDVKEGEWIEIDGYKLTHKDVYAFLTDPIYLEMDSVELKHAINEFEKDYYMTTSIQRQFLPGADSWEEASINSNLMAYELFTKFVAKVRSIDSTSIDVYDFRNDANLLYAGDLIMRRKDNEDIVIITSKDYPISVIILDKF